MKVIFMDVDGVINSAENGWKITPFKVRMVNEVASATGAFIVISSDWRIEANDRQAIRNSGINFIDCTADYNDRPREIAEWVATHEVENYVIIDDTDFKWSKEQRKHFVQTKTRTGITERKRDRAIKIMNK